MMRPIARYGFLGNVRKLLSQAAFFIDAKESGMGQTATNLGTAGSVLDAQYGSTTGADTNDPLLLEHGGTNYLYLPGVAGNRVTVPSSAALNLNTDIELVMRCSIAFVGSTGLVNKQIQYRVIQGSSAGVIQFQVYDPVALAWSGNPAPVIPDLADGKVVWLKMTRVSATGVISYFYANDQPTEPSTWAFVASVTAMTGALTPTGNDLEIGSRDGGFGPLPGSMYRVILRDGIGGTVVFDADFTTGITSGSQTTFTESSSNAATVTINRSTSGRKSVAVVRDVWLFGTDDYLEVADNDLLDFGASDSFTVVAIVRQWATTADRPIVSKTAAGQGWKLSQQTTNRAYMQVYDTVYPTATDNVSAGVLSTIAGVRDATADQVRISVNGGAFVSTLDTTTTTLANASPLRVGHQVGGALLTDMELLGVAVFRRALSADEIASIANYYSAS